MFFFLLEDFTSCGCFAPRSAQGTREVPPKVMDDRPEQGGYFPTCEQKFAKFEDQPVRTIAAKSYTLKVRMILRYCA